MRIIKRVDPPGRFSDPPPGVKSVQWRCRDCTSEIESTKAEGCLMGDSVVFECPVCQYEQSLLLRRFE